MTAAKKPPPPWLDLSRPMSDTPRLRRCPWCRAPVLTALVGNPCGLNVRADPVPLGLAAELQARLQGRFSYCLRLHPYLPPRLIRRSPEHIAAGRCTHLVVADHQCPAGTPAVPAARPDTSDRLF
ncbi:hypothetical protein ACIOUE_00795 [Streptomyces xanthochromogenes]|uniref:hypothetical protein n=1 Tax=Streptomyces xanthochromogenes TaxID=67384 RepID=UPI00380E05F4